MGQCVPASTMACGGQGCGCNNLAVTQCGSYASAPLASEWSCSDVADSGKPPPPCVSSVACEQCDVSGYSPTVMSKPLVELNACTQQEMADFVTACFSSTATQQTCNAWQMSVSDAGPCVSCVLTLQSSSAWGAFVCTSSTCTTNIGGCVDLVLGEVSQEKKAGGSGSCGDLVNAAYGCQFYACDTCSTPDFDTCVQSASANECSSYETPITSPSGPCPLTMDAGPIAKCFPQANTDITSFLNVFCGTGP